MSTLPAVAPMTPAEFREAREALGYTQEQLARVFDVTEKTIRNMESGRVRIDARTTLALQSLEKKDPGGREVATPSSKER